MATEIENQSSTPKTPESWIPEPTISESLENVVKLGSQTDPEGEYLPQPTAEFVRAIVSTQGFGGLNPEAANEEAASFLLTAQRLAVILKPKESQEQNQQDA